MPVFRIFRHYVPGAFLLLGLMELIVFILSFHSAVYIRFASDSSAVAEHVGRLWPKSVTFAAVMLLSMIGLGLYDRLSCTWENRSAMVLRVIAGFLFAVFPLAFIFYVIPQLSVWRGPAVMAVGISLIAVTTIRLIFVRVVDQKVFKRRVLVLGTGNNALEINRLEGTPELRGVRVVGYVHMSRDHNVVKEERVIYRERTLADVVRENQVEEIVVALDDRRKALPVHEILDCKMEGVMVIDLLTFLERETGKINLPMVRPSWLFLSDGFRISSTSLALKRALDISVSLLLLPLFLPVMSVVAVAIWMESPGEGSVIYKQTRVGIGEKEFKIYKFRSMRANAEEDGHARWASKNDARVTRVGAVIRKVRLDEMPQLFNVIKGDMSLVGPRPERPQFVKQLAEQYPYYRERHRVRPGLTGWAQIRYEYGDTFEGAFEKLQYDLYYVKNCSIFLDLLIIVHTMEVILMGKGAH
jgi:sugar transferase (PEP-CTERM system associated)